MSKLLHALAYNPNLQIPTDSTSRPNLPHQNSVDVGDEHAMNEPSGMEQVLPYRRGCQRCRDKDTYCSQQRPCESCVVSGCAADCIAQTLRPARDELRLFSLSPLLPAELVDYCSTLYKHNLSTTIPMVTLEYLETLRNRVYLISLQSPYNTPSPQDNESACLLAAFCAMTILQLAIADERLSMVSGKPSAGEHGRMLLKVCMITRERLPLSGAGPPTFEQILLPYTLYGCHSALSQHRLAFIRLREACTMCTLIAWEGIQLHGRDLMTNLYWVLLITERAEAVRHQKHLVTLRNNHIVALPAVPPQLMGSRYRAELYRAADIVFIALSNGELSDAMISLSYLDNLEDSFDDAIPDMAQLDPGQVAMLAVTQAWLKGHVWRVRMRAGQLLETSTRRSRSLYFPVLEVRRLLSITQKLPLQTFRAHGFRISERLFDIASAAVDVLARVPPEVMKLQDDDSHTSAEEDLAALRSFITRLPGGTDVYEPLLRKQIQQNQRLAIDMKLPP